MPRRELFIRHSHTLPTQLHEGIYIVLQISLNSLCTIWTNGIVPWA